MDSHKDSSRDQVIEVIDRVLTQVFGPKSTRLIYKHLEHNYSLKRDQIIERIDVFAEGLEEFLSSGAIAVERKILEDAYSSYGLLSEVRTERQSPDPNFVDQVRNLMQKA